MMESRRLLWFISFLLLGARVSAIQTLHNTDDLKSIEFGHEYPRHGLLLLYWLADHVSVNETEGIKLHFNPERQDYGFQFYKTPQDVQNTALPHLDDPLDRVYYSVGSLSSQNTRIHLPPFVTQDYYNSADDPNNDVDRIIVRVQKNSPSRADRVYITQAVSRDSDFDQNKTYEISSKLLEQVQVLQKPLDVLQALESGIFGSPDATATPSDDPRLRLTKEELLTHLKHKDRRLQSIFEEPGLRWLLSLAGYDIDGRYDIHKRTWLCSANETVQHEESASDPETLCEAQNPVKIEIKTAADGYAKIKWSGVPKNILEQDCTVAVYSSDTSSFLEVFNFMLGRTSGGTITFISVKHGLHPRLVRYSFGSSNFFGIHYNVIWRGPQFHDANRVIPTEISGYDASLQLYTSGGYACARLYIKKTFKNWKDEFQDSWVGFYVSEKHSVNNYYHYQWVSYFKKVSDKDKTKAYLIYEYQSSMSIGSGVQARFLFARKSGYIERSTPILKASTVPWGK